MSDALYPLSAISAQKITPYSRVVADEFESGETSTRRLWAARNFKRQVVFQHPPLTFEEFRYLRSFYQQREGLYDSFWFRDNINRGGNLKCRFTKPMSFDKSSMVYRVDVSLDEIAPIHVMPDLDEIEAAAGSPVIAWYDPQRERYTLNLGSVTTEAALADNARGAYPGVWQSSTTLPLAGIAAQWQYLAFTGTQWARTAGTVTEVIGDKPNCTILLFARCSSSASVQMLAGIGDMGAETALGIIYNGGTNGFEISLGSGTYVSGPSLYNSGDIWKGLAVTSADNNLVLYADGAPWGNDSGIVRTFAPGKFSVGAAPDGTMICNPSNAMANANIGTVLLFAATLTADQVAAVHNLFAYQYGI